MKLTRRTVRWILVILLLSAVGVAWVVFGTGIYRVNAASMQPTLSPGSVILTYQTDDLSRRDIVAYRKPEGGLVAHTFIGYADDGSLMTRGDANSVADNHVPPLTKDRLVGKVFIAVTPMKALGAGIIFLAVVLTLSIPTREEGEVPPATPLASTPA